MGKVIPGRWQPDAANTSPRLKARGAKSGAGPPYQLKVSLLEIEPEIWRQVCVPGGVSLDRLHKIFQVAMGWTRPGGVRWRLRGGDEGSVRCWPR
jgi:hypothetical protein